MRCQWILGAGTIVVLVTGCAGAEIRRDLPIMLNGEIQNVTQCTFQALDNAGYGPPGLKLLTFADQNNKARILYSATTGGEVELGAPLLIINFEQLSANQVQAKVTPTAVFGDKVALAAVPALQSCQSN